MCFVCLVAAIVSWLPSFKRLITCSSLNMHDLTKFQGDKGDGLNSGQPSNDTVFSFLSFEAGAWRDFLEDGSDVEVDDVRPLQPASRAMPLVLVF